MSTADAPSIQRSSGQEADTLQLPRGAGPRWHPRRCASDGRPAHGQPSTCVPMPRSTLRRSSPTLPAWSLDLARFSPSTITALCGSWAARLCARCSTSPPLCTPLSGRPLRSAPQRSLPPPRHHLTAHLRQTRPRPDSVPQRCPGRCPSPAPEDPRRPARRPLASGPRRRNRVRVTGHLVGRGRHRLSQQSAVTGLRSPMAWAAVSSALRSSA